MKSIVQADHIICVSEHTRRELLRYLPVDPSRVTVVWNGIDHYQYHTRDKLDCRRLLGLPEDATIVLHVGSEEPRKNIPVLLKSFQLVSAHVTNPLLVRLGDATPENAKLISSLGIADRVKYLHGLSDPSLAYGAADVLCFPSKSEGFGLPPLEAMACGCPVVASNGGALGEVVGEAALVIDAEDSAGFAKAMERVLTDSNLRVTLVTRGLARAGEFDWSRCAQETARIYSQVMIDFSRQDA
jgi:glycosyltransferase involved in cell wall biosynthesis